MTVFVERFCSELASVEALARLGITKDLIAVHLSNTPSGRRATSLLELGQAASSAGSSALVRAVEGRSLLQNDPAPLKKFTSGSDSLYVMATVGPFGPEVTRAQADTATAQVAINPNSLFTPSFKDAFGITALSAIPTTVSTAASHTTVRPGPVALAARGAEAAGISSAWCKLQEGHGGWRAHASVDQPRLLLEEASCRH